MTTPRSNVVVTVRGQVKKRSIVERDRKALETVVRLLNVSDSVLDEDDPKIKARVREFMNELKEKAERKRSCLDSDTEDNNT